MFTVEDWLGQIVGGLLNRCDDQLTDDILIDFCICVEYTCEYVGKIKYLWIEDWTPFTITY